MQVSVIIVTWNAEKFIKDCLDSVFAQTFNELDVIIVDNNSTDQTLNIVNDYLPRIRIIKNDKNQGFCFANNQALAIVKGNYILTLNSDMILDKHYISYLKEYLDKNCDIGMVQGKFLRADRKTIDSLGLYLSPSKRLFDIAKGRVDGPKYTKAREIFGPCAAAAMYRKELLDAVKQGEEFFDNSFYFLVEDFDIAWRARNKGWKAMFVPQAVCCHFRGSSNHSFKFKQYLSFRNRYFMLIKNLSLKTALGYGFYFLVYDLPRLCFLPLRNPYIIKAMSEILQSLPELSRKRYKYTKIK